MTIAIMPDGDGVSPTLAANELAASLRREGRTILHMGFGEAPFPVHPRLARALEDGAGARSYLPVAGLPELREAVARHHERVAGLTMDGHDVLVGPGSKAILFAIELAVPGDTLLPVPSWVSYRPQATMLGRAVIDVPTTIDERGLVIEADALDRTIHAARAAGRNPTKIVLNSPSNPTGLVIPDGSLRDVAEVCGRHDILIVSDEIYGRLAFDGGYGTIARHAPERTVVTTGLSKHLSLGGWRVGVGLVPRAIGELFPTLTMIASETWSCVASPVQWAAVEAYAGHDDVEDFIALSRRIHADVTGVVAERLQGMGVSCIRPQGGFYLWPEVPCRGGAARIDTSTDLSRVLLQDCGIVTLPGTAFGERPETLRLRLSACDYDGAAALAAYERGAPNDIGAFAPRISAALDGFEAFLAT